MPDVKCVLIHDNFQNFKSYNIPKAQLVIADIPYNIGSDFYASRPDWYVDGDNRNGESDKARKAAFNTDFTFNIADKALRGLMGTVVENVGTSVPGTKFKASGPLLVTHWGMSGPAILKLSSHAARFLSENNYRVRIAVNWIGESDRAVVENCVQIIVRENPQKQLSNVRPFNLPTRLWMYLIAKMGLAPDRKWGEMGKKMCNVLIETLTNDGYQVEGKGTFKEEFVTCGGVALENVNMNTLESKVCPHLFFAGEVLDIDAVTGGFNLQAAWTTGFVVGQNIVA